MGAVGGGEDGRRGESLPQVSPTPPPLHLPSVYLVAGTPTLGEGGREGGRPPIQPLQLCPANLVTQAWRHRQNEHTA